MAAQDSERAPAPQTSFFNDPVIRGRIYQLIVALVVLVFFWFIAQNTAENLARQNKTTGFDFFFATSGFDIFFTLIPYSRASEYWQAFVVGLLNTLLVSLLGIIFATIWGFILGIARLSSNWIISRLAVVYIETLRNIPLLLQLFFWYFAVLKAMPSVKQSFIFFGEFALNNRGLNIPRPVFDDKFFLVVIAIVVAIAGGIVLAKWARKRLEATGQRFPTLITSLAVLIVLPAIVWLISGTNVGLDVPKLAGFNFKGGISLPPEFVALLVGLILYTSTFIAEIVRSGIQAVSHGQTEAAAALGLKEGDRLRLVVIPQAMRVIIPPLTSQYLNLTKNSSLAAAIGYPELVSVFMGTTLNQTGRAIEVVFVTMMVYLTLSLLTSAFMNWYNARVALVER
ncbi:amino acid ABC transporter permease [Devosia rhodophyticola]|uniref:Amino acid ABC transporter permease n=1 Tax=Devosia rhodophyticola TaxID=3026423 RepID=A0ABY7YWW1_9HYPH|nr:amino acid ABC transporter permease [Devosia rhodophyticola]WDR05578.1 amino acid ABC transporter permease [Devosia rhodophyticola]